MATPTRPRRPRPLRYAAPRGPFRFAEAGQSTLSPGMSQGNPWPQGQGASSYQPGNANYGNGRVPGNLAQNNPNPPLEAPDPNKPPLTAVGASGTVIMGGIIAQTQEYNPDFYWKDAIVIYERMRRNDAQVKALLEMLFLPILSTDWYIEPASDAPVDMELASFLESCLMHDMVYETTEGRKLTQTWSEVLRHILLMLPFGFIPLAKWWYEDAEGYAKWARWEPLLPSTVWRWYVGADTQLAGIQQRTWKGWQWVFEDIHADRLILFVNDQEGNNFDGFSVLRAAYKHWFYKDNFYKIQAIGIERTACMPPIAILAPDDLDTGAATAMLTQVNNMRVSDQMGVVLRNGQKIEFPANHTRGGQEVDTAIQHHDTMIARAILADFLTVGASGAGTYDLAEVKYEQFLYVLNAKTAQIADKINTDAIPELINYNFDGVTTFPKLKARPIKRSDLQQIAPLVPYLGTDPQLTDWLRDLVGAPAAPQSVVEATNPTGSGGPQGADGGGQNSRADEGTPMTGTNADAQDGTTDATSGGGSDSGGGGDGGGGGLSEERETALLLREALSAVYGGGDAVNRALLFSGHDPGYDSQPHVDHGHWGPGQGSSSGGGAGGRAAGAGELHLRAERGTGGGGGSAGKVPKAAKAAKAPKAKAAGKAAKATEPDAAFRKSVADAYKTHGDKSGRASIHDVREHVTKALGISHDEFAAKLNAYAKDSAEGKTGTGPRARLSAEPARMSAHLPGAMRDASGNHMDYLEMRRGSAEKPARMLGTHAGKDYATGRVLNQAIPQEDLKAAAEARLATAKTAAAKAEREFKAAEKARDEARTNNKAEIDRLTDERHTAYVADFESFGNAKNALLEERAHTNGAAGKAPVAYAKMLAAKQPYEAAKAAYEAARATERASDTHWQELYNRYSPNYAPHQRGLYARDPMMRDHPDLKAALAQHMKDSSTFNKAQTAWYRAANKYEGPRQTVAGKITTEDIEAHPLRAGPQARLKAADEALGRANGETRSRVAFQVYGSAKNELKDAQQAMAHPSWKYQIHEVPTQRALYKSFEEWPASALRAARSADKARLDVHEGDRALSELQHTQGYDSKPSIVSELALEHGIKRGDIEIWRGDSKQSHTDNMMMGDHHAGLGIRGSGTYAQEANHGGETTARSYAKDHSDGLIIRMAIKSDARVIQFSKLQAVAQRIGQQARTDEARAQANGDRAALERAQTMRWLAEGKSENGVSRLATVLGYDAIRIPSVGQVIVLNRTAVRISHQVRG